MKVSVDQGKCCAAGHCALAAPEVFDQREEDGTVVLLDARPPLALRDSVAEASFLCPAAAIAVED
ncbi:ferredoxin [Streptomyces violaceusniger]|uniref:ferredoxin n=1 Tax=Streptomyces violaceusniger TaxID=68280 RepID=UPI0005B9467A|nr:ferredoxin [Streptomyces violaceusniger]